MNSKLVITRRTNKSTAQLRRVAEIVANKLKDDYSLSWKWNANTIVFSCTEGLAKGTSGTLTVGGGQAQLIIHLPLMLQGAAPKIEKTIGVTMDELIQ